MLRRCNFRIVLPKVGFPNVDSTLVQELSLGVISLHRIHVCQLLNKLSEPRVVGPQNRFAYSKTSLENGESISVSPLLEVERTEFK